MSEAAIVAMRQGAAFTVVDHVTSLRVSGPDAFAAVDRIVPRELFLRDGQILHTLLLRDDARPLADLYVCQDDADYLLLAEGLTASELTAQLQGDITVTDLATTHGLIALDGPYAWEVFAELAGPEVIGQPYMTFFHSEGLTAFRAGKSGEFGYYLQVPRDRLEALRATLLDRGAAFDIVEGDLAAIDQCALENWYFNIRREGLAEATPVELQLQWRVSAKKKQFPGAEALAARRGKATQRLVMCTAPSALAIGDIVTHAGATIGTIINAGFSPVRKDWVATALLDRAYSHAGVRAYSVGSTPLATIAAPALDNRSLYINPQLHSYHTRHEVQFPPIVPMARS